MSLTPDDLAAIRAVMQEEVAHTEARLGERIDQVETGLRAEFGQRLEAVEMSMRAAISQSEINLRREFHAAQRANVRDVQSAARGAAGGGGASGRG